LRVAHRRVSYPLPPSSGGTSRRERLLPRRLWPDPASPPPACRLRYPLIYPKTFEELDYLEVPAFQLPSFHYSFPLSCTTVTTEKCLCMSIPARNIIISLFCCYSCSKKSSMGGYLFMESEFLHSRSNTCVVGQQHNEKVQGY